MNWNAICTVYLKELTDTLRDKRTVITTFLIPTVVIPGIIFGAGFIMTKVIKKAQTEATSVMIIGEENAPELAEQIRENEKFRVVEASDDFRDQISNKKIRVAVEIPEGFEEGVSSTEAPDVMIYHYEGEMKSSMGRGELNGFLNDYRSTMVQAGLKERGLPKTIARPFNVESENVAPPEKVGGNAFGGFIPYIVVILCMTGAMYPAMDLTAGEKERGTMETLLCSPVNRVNIVMGKFLMTLSASIATMLLSLVMFGVSALVAGKLFAGGGDAAAGAAGGEGGGFMMSIDPWGMIGVFAMILPMAVLFAAGLLTVSLFAKSFKEAQSYVSPLMILVILPAVVGTLPGIELTWKTALMPITSLSLVCKEMLSGVWNWHFIGVVFGSQVIYAAIALWLCVKMFGRESVIFRA
ncbi:MAG: ABC transporter permease [Synoicihabitans sp.]